MPIVAASDSRMLNNISTALDRVCQSVANGDDKELRQRVIRQIIECACSGRTDLNELTAAGQRALVMEPAPN